MAQLISVKLSRYDNSPWGFRLQGGKDFGTPLVIQKVNGGSPAEKAGLQAGDAVLRINNVDATALRHKDAQDVIVRAGNCFELAIQRGGVGTSTWKPSVTPVGPSPVKPGAGGPVTKTSLTYKGPAPQPIGTGHNTSAKPFGTIPHMNGGPEKQIVNKQFNSPIGIYSEQAIAETLSAQAEVLTGGAIGVNFKKNEKEYNAANSEVLKMVQEADKEPRVPEPERPASTTYFATHSHAVGGRASPGPGRPRTPLASPAPNVAPSPAPAPPGPPCQPSGSGTTSSCGLSGAAPDASETPKCAECERIIVGVFVRIKDKNLHVECFKCATCGTPLKNVGYYNLNNKLYCDIHAKMVARQNPPAPNLEPVTVAPGARPPAGTISNALAGLGVAPASPVAPGAPLSPSPQPGTVGPLPFHAPRVGTSHVSAPKPMPQTPSSVSGPRPFGAPAPSAPASAPSNAFGRPAAGGPGGAKGGAFAGSSAPVRGRGILNPAAIGSRIPLCGACNQQIRGPFITALGKIWCPHHFVCSNSKCQRPLQDIGFVEEKGHLYCEYCFEQFIAPPCNKCGHKIKGDCLNAIGKHFHPECFNCVYCGKLFGNNPFFLEDGQPYCENDWNELFTTKCFACGFPIEAGDRWVEALSNNYHSQCFNCSMCKKNLEGQSFFAKGGRPFCKTHAR